MKTLFFLFVIAGISSTSFNLTQNEKCIFSREHFAGEKWYDPMLAALSEHDRIDSHAGHYIRMLSSNSRVTRESDADTKRRLGKTGEEDIRVMCLFPEKPQTIYVLTREGVYHFLFTYDIHTGLLERVKNTEAAVMTDQKLLVSGHDKKGFTLRCYSEYSEHRTYFRYDAAANTFRRSKNCKVTDGKESCVDIKPL